MIVYYIAGGHPEDLPAPARGAARQDRGPARRYYTILYYTILYYTILYYTILYYILLD